MKFGQIALQVPVAAAECAGPAHAALEYAREVCNVVRGEAQLVLVGGMDRGLMVCTFNGEQLAARYSLER